ncbi:MAG TPA: metallophosphoesterase, partial [Pirellula sp.]|nr:metallophosphoesterase [Pirellula sp.]
MNSRRHFITTLGASTLALSLRHVSLGQRNSEAMQIALLSDTHLHADPMHEYRRFRPYDNLVQASNQVSATDAKFALLCGDAARLEGKKEDYVQLKKLLEPITNKMKMEIALGNHDDRTNFWTVFDDRPIDKALAGKKHVTVADLGPQRWIVLDSLMYVDKVPGFLGEVQRDWLDRFLGSEISRPVV